MTKGSDLGLWDFEKTKSGTNATLLDYRIYPLNPLDVIIYLPGPGELTLAVAAVLRGRRFSGTPQTGRPKVGYIGVSMAWLTGQHPKGTDVRSYICSSWRDALALTEACMHLKFEPVSGTLVTDVAESLSMQESVTHKGVPLTHAPHSSAGALAGTKGVERWRSLALSEMIVPKGWDRGQWEALMLSIIEHESGGDPGATGPTHDRGLMQVIDEEAKKLGYPVPLYDPQQNVAAGGRILARAWMAVHKSRPAVEPGSDEAIRRMATAYACGRIVMKDNERNDGNDTGDPLLSKLNFMVPVHEFANYLTVHQQKWRK